MATIVNVKIKNNTYQVACDDDQDMHVKKLAVSVNERIKKLSKNFPKASDTTLLVMTALMMENEINEYRAGNNFDNVNSDHAVTETINAVSDYVETLAKRLEKIYNDA